MTDSWGRDNIREMLRDKSREGSEDRAAKRAVGWV